LVYSLALGCKEFQDSHCLLILPGPGATAPAFIAP
jgi:hypothetical protein